MTPPYFHDGSVDKLDQAVWNMAKIQLGKDVTKRETGDLAAFLSSLTGRISDDALAVPIVPSAE